MFYIGRIVCTVVGAHIGARVAGWIFDTATGRSRS